MTGLLVIALVAAVVAARAVVVVPAEHAFVVERLGRFRTVLAPGFHVLLPFVDRVGRRHRLGDHTIVLGATHYVTRDNHPVSVDATVVARVVDPIRATYEVADWPTAVAELGRTILRKAIGGRDQLTLRTESGALAAELKQHLQSATAAWGIEIRGGEIAK
jgi:regulator of protease activity HflC (stomatin/prohibitin superfamily)